MVTLPLVQCLALGGINSINIFMADDLIIKTGLSIRQLIFGILGALFFGVFACQIITSPIKVAHGTDKQTGTIIVYIILALFTAFSILCAAMALCAKTYVLNANLLIIKRPLLLIKRIVPLTDIKHMREKTHDMKSSYRGSEFTVYSGLQTVITLKNDKKITIKSFETGNYKLLISNLFAQFKQRNSNPLLTTKSKYAINDWQGYGWIILLAILTAGLIYSLITS
jgi:hypothetical protein